MALKRTWMVSVSQEMKDGITQTRWYGPYTRSQAEALAQRLNALIGDLDLGVLGDKPVAVATPLLTLTPREVLDQFDKELLEGD